MKKAILAAAATALLSTPAFAQTDAQEYQELVQGAKITYSEAGDIAAQKVGGGTVVKSELDNHRLKVVFEVAVLTNDGRLFEVNVNAADGSVINVKEDRD